MCPVPHTAPSSWPRSFSEPTMVSESFVHACAGGAGGLVAMTATYPLMGISTRAAVDQSKNPGESLVKAITTVMAKEGITLSLIHI